MKKTLAKLLCLALVLAMTLGLAVTASAAIPGYDTDGENDYYANMYRYYNSDGTLKNERNSVEYINSVYGEWAARNQALRSLGAPDDMMNELLVKYWESYGMKKELFHEGEADEAVYAVYSPMYRPEGKEFPLLVVCHGGGSNIYDAEQFGFIEEAAKRGYIALFISWGNNPYKETAKAEGITSEAYTFKKAYDEVIENYPIDTTRVYVAGFSGGGNAAAYIGGTYPELVTAIMSSTGAGLQGSAQSIDEDAGTSSLAKAKEYGLPLFMGYGLLDNENRWPVSDQLSEMGPHTDTTVEERLAFLNEWVEASGAQMEPMTMEELAEINALEDHNANARARFGLNFNKDYTKELYGYTYIFGDGLNADGDVVLRFMGVPLAGHQLSYGWAEQYLDFAENFYRDAETGKIVVAAPDDTPYYANMYRYYNEDGTLKNERQTAEFVNSVYGAWAARNQYLSSQGSADDMMTEFIVKYWETYGMEKTLYHENEEDEAVYAVYAPMYMEDGVDYPLLVVCHGGGSNIYAAEQFGFIEEAAERGYIAVFISWGNNPYREAAKAEGITSEAYTFKKAYDEVIENYPIDTTRVYVAGFSGGGNAAAYIGGTYPELVTAIMSSTGAGLQGSAQSIDADAGTSSLAKAKEYGLPLFMGYGMLDTENRWPVSDLLSEMGPHTDTTVEERLAFLNEWVEASGAQMEPMTMEELAEINALEDRNANARARFGLNFNEDYTKTLYFGRDYVNEDVGYDYLFGDGLNENGDVVLRFMAVPMAGHQLTYGWAHEYLDFAENFSRDPETGKIVVKSADVAVSTQKLTVDGAAADAEKYNIDGYNYFKLRDVAALLNGTDAQFGVSYDADSATITVTPGMAYEPVGGELAVGADNSASCVKSRWTLLVGGEEQTFTVYNIGGYNFFKLRDLGEALGFGVSFNDADNTAAISTKDTVAAK